MSRLDRLNDRRSDFNVTEAKLLNESYRNIAQSESVRYVIGAMQPIDPEYTKNTFLQGDRVRKQLENGLNEKCEYKYQGSVTNNTHIKARSDIDLLVIIKKFFSLEPPQKPSTPYDGNSIEDLLELRNEAGNLLLQAFPEADVDVSGHKSITAEGGSLRRKIDVVISNWHNTNEYAEKRKEIYRGIKVLDISVPCTIKNTPFLHNEKVEEKDHATEGGFRKACRLMKSLKYDTENIDLSSYDIVSIAFNMPNHLLKVPYGGELVLLSSCLDYCRNLYSNSDLQNSIDVPDGHRKVFASGHATSSGLGKLVAEIENVKYDVLSENIRSFRKLSEARIEY